MYGHFKSGTASVPNYKCKTKLALWTQNHSMDLKYSDKVTHCVVQIVNHSETSLWFTWHLQPIKPLYENKKESPPHKDNLKMMIRHLCNTAQLGSPLVLQQRPPLLFVGTRVCELLQQCCPLVQLLLWIESTTTPPLLLCVGKGCGMALYNGGK